MINDNCWWSTIIVRYDHADVNRHDVYRRVSTCVCAVATIWYTICINWYFTSIVNLLVEQFRNQPSQVVVEFSIEHHLISSGFGMFIWRCWFENDFESLPLSSTQLIVTSETSCLTRLLVRRRLCKKKTVRRRLCKKKTL